MLPFQWTTKLIISAPSIHSRAARREASPSLNTDKSLKEARAPSPSHDHLYARPQASGGIRKKKKASTKAQKARHAAALERADIVKEQIQVKKSKSFVKMKSIRNRRKDWEDVNGVKRRVAFEALPSMDIDDEQDSLGNSQSDEAEETIEVEAETSEIPLPVKESAAVAPTQVKLPESPPQDEDEIQ
jgi:hypothetical protein